MFSIFTYLFCTTVSFYASARFWRLWKKSGNPNYKDFALFFLVMGTGFTFFIYPFVFPYFPIPAGFSLAIMLFLILFSFAFVLRTFVRFQNLTAVSPVAIMAVVTVCSLAELVIALLFPSVPVIDGALVYWHSPLLNSAMFGVFCILFTFTMAVTLLSNLKNIKAHKSAIMFLGIAFFLGGLGGTFTTNFNIFWPLLSGYILLFITFIFVALFIISSSGKKE